eukprot:Gregarina_sp_Pseudo_9__4879@NODE_50_length_4806_cov_19_581708_g47_i0_p3_GENE_NODE_50_length_4806_cov_19_581708_g47_i0NODE_50_length_4806_cov_19_581708_g47_i0_p3_ORF_typecomplete_len405_score40_34Exo_endo_phos/PF03372_23/1_3e09_NODE_50_length_4806_cov_19_581708_g47_i030414255
MLHVVFNEPRVARGQKLSLLKKMGDGSPSSHQESNPRAASSPKEAPTQSKPVETTNPVSDAAAILRETAARRAGLKNKRPRETDEEAGPETNRRETDGVSRGEKRARLETPVRQHTSELIGILSWNIDGLSEDTAMPRTLAVIDCIRNLKPACIFLQEVIPATEGMFRKYLSGPYHLLTQGEKSNWVPSSKWPSATHAMKMPYYCMILLSKFHFEAPANKTTADTFYFPNTQMGRALLSVRTVAKAGGFPVRLATSHLESTNDQVCSTRRKAQIAQVFDWIQEEALSLGDRGLLVFAGDLNIRDTEVKEHDDFLKASGIFDVWEKLGSKEATKWTWNRRINCNLGKCSNRGARLRFDRMYCWRGGDAPVEVCSLELTGTELIDANDFKYFPSDHFGLWVNWAVG